MVDELEGSYEDYISFIFGIFQRHKAVPQPAHLTTKNARQWYQTHQKMKNIYDRKEYVTNGDFLTVKKTWKTYPLSQVSLPISQDTIALRAYRVVEDSATKGLPEDEEDRDACFYLEAKLKYKGSEIPDSVKKILEELV
jgi:hypothetical protein